MSTNNVESADVAAGDVAPTVDKDTLSVGTLSLASYDKRLNPDAPVFVPRSHIIPATTLAQKFMNDVLPYRIWSTGEDISCGRVYDSIWRESSATPKEQSVHTERTMNAFSLPLASPMLSSPLPPPLSMMPLFDSTQNLYRPIARPPMQQRTFMLRRTQSQSVTTLPLNVDAPEYVPHIRRSNSNVSDSSGTFVTMELPQIDAMTPLALVAEHEREPTEVMENEILVDEDQQEAQQQQQQLELQSKGKCLIKSKLPFQSADRKLTDPDGSDDDGRDGCCCSIM